MKAKVTQTFQGVPDGQIHTREIAPGEVIEGDLAAVAVREKWAEEVVEERVDDDSLVHSKKPPKKHK
jgi:hypothetical protein